MATTITQAELKEPKGQAKGPTVGKGRLATTTSAFADARAAAKEFAVDAASKVPGLTATTRNAVDQANRTIQASTDEMLTVGTAVSFGLALGLLLGGASRILVVAAMVPAAMMGFTLLDRASTTRHAERTPPTGL